MNEKRYEIKETAEEDLAYLYSEDALTFEGLSTDEKNLNLLYNSLKHQGAEPKEGMKLFVTSGKLMNEHYRLTGTNRYQDDLSIVSIPLCELGNHYAISFWKLRVGGRWFSDIVDNNARREGR